MYSSGHQLGPYQLLAPIGEGGMGEVWKARDTRLDRIVALKISKQEFTERFEREARAIAALNHPNICQLYDVGPNYLVMEYIEGTQLKGPVPVEKAVEHASQILDALDAAHKKGITHRDLKPANILITKQGIKLLDFGLAKQTGPLRPTDATLTKALTAEGQIAGTLQYMSPEQLQAKDADARSDIFAFGCVLYELIGGNKAFHGESAASVIAAILEREPVALQLSPPLDRVIRKCLAKDPDDRFQATRDLKTALNWALEQRPPVETISLRKWPWMLAAAAALLVVAAVGGFLGARKSVTPMPALRLTILPPPGVESIEAIALSPDGSSLAVAAANRLWVRDMTSGSYKSLPGTEGGNSFCWSPDGQQLAFGSSVTAEFKRTKVSGGAPVKLLDSDRGECSWKIDGDGEAILIWTAAGIRRVDLPSGTVTPLQLEIGGKGPHPEQPAFFVPGGRFLVYASTAHAERPLRLRDLGTARESVVETGLDGYHLIATREHIIYPKDESIVARRYDAATGAWTAPPVTVGSAIHFNPVYNGPFTASMNGMAAWLDSVSYQAAWVDRAGRRTPVPGAPEAPGAVRLSFDGSRAVFAAGRRGESDLWQLDLQRGVGSRMTRFPLAEGNPVWNRAGTQIYFHSRHLSGTRRDLFVLDASGTGAPELVYRNALSKTMGDVSPDGAWLLFTETREGRSAIFALQLPGGSTRNPEPYLVENFDCRMPRFSPDGRWVAYASNESGQSEVYVQSFPRSRKKWRVSTHGGTMPVWSPTGKELFYYEPGSSKLMAVAVQSGADLTLGKSAELFSARLESSIDWGYDVARDSQKFLICSRPSSQTATLLTRIDDASQ